MVKIGWTDVEAGTRVRQLQTGNPNELKVILRLEGGRAEERALHERFAADRRHGEWFVLSPALLQFLWDRGSREVVPPVITADHVRFALQSFDHKPYRLRTIVEALAEETTAIAESDDESDAWIRAMMRVYLRVESDPTEMDALQRLFWYFLAPPSAYARLRKDPALRRLNDAMQEATGMPIGPRLGDDDDSPAAPAAL